jgi:hypothetical protein
MPVLERKLSQRHRRQTSKLEHEAKLEGILSFFCMQWKLDLNVACQTPSRETIL